jgi:hypothetical protein
MNDDNFSDKPSTRERILYIAAKLTAGDRNKAYGEPVQNMQDIAALWQVYIDGKRRHSEGHLRLSGEDVAHMMSLMKIARTFVPRLSPDTYIDSACYEAIAGECAEVERNGAIT